MIENEKNKEGNLTQIKQAINKPIKGAIENKMTLDVKGKIFCFKKNLKASNKVCTNPIKEILFGPTRLWNKLIILRSNKIKNATDKNINKQWITHLANRNNIKHKECAKTHI